MRSGDQALPDPEAISQGLTYAQIEDMTRRAVELAGGFDELGVTSERYHRRVAGRTDREGRRFGERVVARTRRQTERQHRDADTHRRDRTHRSSMRTAVPVAPDRW